MSAKARARGVRVRRDEASAHFFRLRSIRTIETTVSVMQQAIAPYQ